MHINITSEHIDIHKEYAQLAGCQGAGAVVTFSGQVREQGERGRLLAMELEHYPDMTEASIAAIVAEASCRWVLLATRVVHRVGRMLPGETIVFVGVAATHRADAFAAAAFIMDFLKLQAPFWKKEITADGAYWVGQKDADRAAAARWHGAARD